MTKEQILYIRNSLNMTQLQLAFAIGTTVATVSRWENGHAIPSPAFKRELTRLGERNGIKISRPLENEIVG